MLERGTLGSDYSPFSLSERTTAEDFSNIQHDVSTTPWPALLREMEATEFLALHTLYNEKQNHSLALLAMNIAISKGLAASKNSVSQALPSENLDGCGRRGLLLKSRCRLMA